MVSRNELVLFCNELRAEEYPLPKAAETSPLAPKSPAIFNLQSDSPGRVTFFGSDSAGASPSGQPGHGTMWTRDAMLERFPQTT